MPHVIRQAVRAPRDVSTRWDKYWAATTATGDRGDVLWDSSQSDEAQRYVDELAAHADTGLPVVDVGCGNGRFTRALARRFPRAVGIDLSAHAVALAQRETSGPEDVEFRAVDMTVPGAGRALADELGGCNVFVRGVLHVLDPAPRRQMAANMADLLGAGGTLLMAETNFSGSLMGYFESLGASARGIPAPLARAISAGLPRPSPFADAEMRDCFSDERWETVLVGTTVINTVPMRTLDTPDSVPGYLAVLRTRPSSGSR